MQLHPISMDYTTWNQMQQNPQINPNSLTDPYAQNPYPDHNYYYYSQTQNPNPNTSIDPQNTYRPSYVSTLVQPPGSESYYTYQPAADGSSAVASSSYYQVPGLVAAAEAVSVDHYGANAYATSVVMPPISIEARKSVNWKKGPKKTKVVQSVWCEICNIECNAKDVLEQHKLGKKHMKNLEKLKGVTTSCSPAASEPSPAPVASNPVSVSVASGDPVIGPQENPEKTKSTSGQKVRKKPGESPEDLETKRRKVVEGGAAVDAIRTCSLCNVVCNSETVFKFHLAGQKHASMVKKQLSSISGAAAAM